MSTTAKDTEGVHRLLDMVVEEVSLVDRAANQHRFLIVKRDDAMDDTTQVNKAPEGADGSMRPNAAPWTVPDDSPLGAALSALESLTAIVELLGSLGADRTDTRLAALAQQLRATAEQILAQTGFPVGPDSPPEPVEASAKSSQAPPADSSFAKNLEAARNALSRLNELTAQAQAARAEKREQPLPGSEPTALTEGLAKLTESLRTLSDTVREQQQRLGRLEKHSGLPNSAAPAERVSKAAPEDVGWPLDLNKPMSRESVDKAVSFHDL